MARDDRMQLIRKIEEEEDARLVVYIMGDRRGLETRIAGDSIPLVFNLLSKIGTRKKIDLFLYSVGGIIMAGYEIVNLIREFCESFNVIVPFKAMSTATLITLGANYIVATKMAELSPVDPSVDSPLGPTVPLPGQPGAVRTVPVNVEDAISFIDLAKKEANLKDEASLSKVFERLSTAVHPLTLGAVNRAREQIGFLARNLLKYHMKEQDKIDKIVSIITRERFSHDYVIGRREAKEVLGLPITEVPPHLEEKIVKLYQEYERLLELNVPYNQEAVLKSANTTTARFDRAIIESTELTYVYRTIKEISRVQVTQPGIPVPVIGYQERVLEERWVEDNTV